MIGLPVFICDGCGACCRTYPVIVSEDDALHEPRIAVQGKQIPGKEVTFTLTPVEGVLDCCFLDAANRCSIYDTRPKICRDFAAGNSQCQEARVKQGILPLTATVSVD